MTGRWVFHPFLLGAFPIISLYAHNVREVRLAQVGAPLLVVLAVVGALWGLLALALKRDLHRAGLVALPLLGLFFLMGPLPLTALRDGLDHASRWNNLLSPLRVTPIEQVVVVLTLGAGLTALTIWRPKRPAEWTPALNRFALVLVVLPMISVLTSWSWTSRRVGAIADTFPALAPPPGPRPDIYYIILDGFGREDVLREIYDYDAGPFLKHLESRGFHVARQSTSNYGQTRLSLASSLNGAYLDDLRDPTLDDEAPLEHLVRHNGLMRALRRLGYTIVDFESGYHITEDMRADVHFDSSLGLGEFHRLLLRNTALAYLLPSDVERDPAKLARARILNALDRLPEVARRPEPTFTFAHILAPHPPFLFRADGSPRDDRSHGFSIGDGDEFQGGSLEEYISGYRGQVAFLADRVRMMVDRLLAESPEPPVIIIQSDHGPGSRLSLHEAARTDMHERLSILNAYHLPGVPPETIGQDISPVNSFRIVLNHYFGANLERLPDRSYISGWWSPYNFLDVTDRARAPRDQAAPR